MSLGYQKGWCPKVEKADETRYLVAENAQLCLGKTRSQNAGQTKILVIPSYSVLQNILQICRQKPVLCAFL